MRRQPFSIRLSAAELAALKRAAAADRRTPGQMARVLLVEALVDRGLLERTALEESAES